MYSLVVENASDASIAQAYLNELNASLEEKGMQTYRLPVIVKSADWENNLTRKGVYVYFDNSPSNENDEYDYSISVEAGVITVKSSETKYAEMGAKALAKALVEGDSVNITFKDENANINTDNEIDFGDLLSQK